MDKGLSILSNPAVIGALVVVWLIEVALMIWALVDWIKRPPQQIRGVVVTRGDVVYTRLSVRILWLVLLLVVNIIGPVVYLTVARLPKPANEPAKPLGSEGAGNAVDALYGRPEGKQ